MHGASRRCGQPPGDAVLVGRRWRHLSADARGRPVAAQRRADRHGWGVQPYRAPGAILAGSDRGIFRSTDGGESWTRVYRMTGGAVYVLGRSRRRRPLRRSVAGLAHSVLVSRDAGRSWRVPSAPLPPASVEGMLGGAGRVYAGVMGATGGRAVWSGGAQGFTALSDGLPTDAHGMSLAGRRGAPIVSERWAAASTAKARGHRGRAWAPVRATRSLRRCW